MGAPVGHVAARIVGNEAELIVAAFRVVGGPRSGSEPHVVVEFLRHGPRRPRLVAARPGWNLHAHGLQLPDASVANQLAGEDEFFVGSLLAADLDDGAVLADHFGHDPPLADRHGHRLLAVDRLARLDRRDRHGHVPVVGRGHDDPVDVVPGEHFAKVAVGGATAGAGQRVDLGLGRGENLRVDVAHRHDLVAAGDDLLTAMPEPINAVVIRLLGGSCPGAPRAAEVIAYGKATAAPAVLRNWRRVGRDGLRVMTISFCFAGAVLLSKFGVPVRHGSRNRSRAVTRSAFLGRGHRPQVSVDSGQRSAEPHCSRHPVSVTTSVAQRPQATEMPLAMGVNMSPRMDAWQESVRTARWPANRANRRPGRIDATWRRCFRHSRFEFVSDFVLRISDLAPSAVTTPRQKRSPRPYIFSTTSIPSNSSPFWIVRAVRSHSSRRLWRSGSLSAFSTGHCSKNVE